MKKKVRIFIFMICLSITMSGCFYKQDLSDDKEMIMVTTLNDKKEEVEIEVPLNPQRVAVLDMAALDIIDTMGMGERVIGTASTSLEYLQEYTKNENIMNLGTIKEANLEAIMASQPEIIFIGGRLRSMYEELSKIAPVVYLETNATLGVLKSTENNAKVIASIFGKEEVIEEKMKTFDSRIQRLSKIAKGKTAIVGMATSGSFNLLGNDARCSLIGNEIGFDNVVESEDAKQEVTSTHGNEASFELVVSYDPDYMFVMDRDAAIKTAGAKLAKDIVENELVKKSKVYKNGNIIYLENAAVWYTAEGGITALDIMLNDLENSLLS